MWSRLCRSHIEPMSRYQGREKSTEFSTLQIRVETKLLSLDAH